MGKNTAQKIDRNTYVAEQTAKLTAELMKNGGKVIDQINHEGKTVQKGTPSGLPFGLAKKIARRQVLKKLDYNFGTLGASDVAKLPSRKERRKAARANKTEFVSVYNGAGARTYKEVFGVGIERFNNKFVTFEA